MTSSLEAEEFLLDQGIGAARSFTLSRDDGSLEKNDDESDGDESTSMHSGVLSVNIKYSEDKKLNYKSRKIIRSPIAPFPELGNTVRKIEEVMALESPSLILSRSLNPRQFNVSDSLSQVISLDLNTDKDMYHGKRDAIIGRTNRLTAFKEKKHLIRYGSGAAEPAGTDQMFLVRNQKFVRKSLVDFSSRCPKWYSPIKLNRPIVLQAQRIDILSPVNAKASPQK
jgi:hypothetical protein